MQTSSAFRANILGSLTEKFLLILHHQASIFNLFFIVKHWAWERSEELNLAHPETETECECVCACVIYLDVLQLQVLRHLKGLTHSENVPYYIFRRVAKWPKLWYYLMIKNIALIRVQQTVHMCIFIHVYRNRTCQYLVSFIDVATDTVFKHVFNQQGVWLITYLNRGDNIHSVNNVHWKHQVNYLLLLNRKKKKTYLEHIFTVDKAESRVGGL